jgi:transcriptional regulator with XRE-family HTH domain
MKSAQLPSANDDEKRRQIGERLRLERERLGLTQQSLADAMEIQRQALMRYESGERSPHADRLHALDRLGGDVSFVVTGRRAGALDDAHKEELELALSTVVLMCRNESNRISEIQKLRIAMELAEDMRRIGQAGFTEAASFAKLRKSIDNANAPGR